MRRWHAYALCHKFRTAQLTGLFAARVQAHAMKLQAAVDEAANAATASAARAASQEVGMKELRQELCATRLRVDQLQEECRRARWAAVSHARRWRGQLAFASRTHARIMC